MGSSRAFVKAGPAKASVQESLNPRLLAQSPASHSFRLTVVRKLHDEIGRLNRENQGASDISSRTKDLSQQDMMKLGDWKKTLEMQGSTQSRKPDKPLDPSSIGTGLKTQEELLVLRQLLLSLKGLDQHGFVITRPTSDEIEAARKGVEASKGFEQCDRCKTRFQVYPGRREDGLLASGGQCRYHHGKPFLPARDRDDRMKGHVDKKYSCCNESIGGTSGCTVAESHVVKFTDVKRLASILQFEETPTNVDVPLDRALSLDCEMCYTVHGLELVRMTATAWPSREEMIDVLVRPMGEILDLNSRFSGVWPEQLAEAKAFDRSSSASSGSDLRIVGSPAAARALLFEQLSPSTPLIGHGLENDLNATRIIHPTIIDSALLPSFRHPRGLPFRHGLKMLVSRHLGRDIQSNGGCQGDGRSGRDDGRTGGGHDSREDARAAGDLVRWAVAERWRNLKRDGWIFRDGSLVSPRKHVGTAA